MTYFSRVRLNPERRESRKLIANPRAMHAAILATFPPEVARAGRVLWRLDVDKPNYTVYVVSPTRPDLRPLDENTGWATEPGQSANYEALLRRVTAGTEWAFRLRANPVRSLPHEQGQRGKVQAHVTVAQQMDWLLKRSERLGFRINPSGEVDPDGQPIPNLAVTGRDNHSIVKFDGEPQQRHVVTLRQAQFDGVLTCTDAHSLRNALTAGIGRGKAYGSGLLTLRKVAS